MFVFLQAPEILAPIPYISEIEETSSANTPYAFIHLNGAYAEMRMQAWNLLIAGIPFELSLIQYAFYVFFLKTRPSALALNCKLMHLRSRLSAEATPWGQCPSR